MRAWIVLVSFILITLSARAELSQVQIKNFSGQFAEEAGSATADRFDFPKQALSTSAVQMNVERYGEGYKFVYGSEEFIWESPPAFVADVDTLDWSSIDVIGKVGGISLKIPSIETTATKGGGSLKGLTANCGNSAFRNLNFADELLINCIKRGVLGLTSFKGKKEEGKNIDVDEVKLTLKNGKLEVEAKVKVGSKMKIKADGTVSYDLNARKITVKINKVKAGVLNVTSKVFKELKKIESDKIEVNKPFIIITLKQ